MQKLKEHFRHHGHIERVHVVRPYITGKGGAAFLRFSRPADARAAVVANNEQQVDGAVLRCAANACALRGGFAYWLTLACATRFRNDFVWRCPSLVAVCWA